MPTKTNQLFQTGDVLTVTTHALVDIPGIQGFVIKAGERFYLDFKCFFQCSAPSGGIIKFDGFTQDLTNRPLPKEVYDLNSQAMLYHIQGFGPQQKQWTITGGAFGEMRVFGVLQNDEVFDQTITVQVGVATEPGNVYVHSARLTILEEITQSSNSNFSSMNLCGCCFDAQLSCCQDQITINTANPDQEFDWKIVDSLDNFYTGTMTTDAEGVGVITVGTDLPDAFLDAPGVSFKITFTSAIPTLAVKVGCVEVETVSGAYLAIAEIGEPLVF